MIKDTMVKLSSNPYRLLHVISVANIAKSIAIKHDISLSDDAYIAGFIHDYAKLENINFHEKYISKEELEKNKNSDVVYHAISAANYFKDKYQINDNIYLSVRNHVFGRPNMTTLEKIIYVSDAIYLNGKKNSKEIYKTAINNLDLAVNAASEKILADLKQRGYTPTKEQLETYKYYKEVIE